MSVRAIRISILVLLFTTISLAQQPKVLAPHDPIAPKVKQPIPLPAAVSGYIAGGPWMVDANFKSTIYLKNIVETSPITVTPVLHVSNGKRYALPAIQLEASGTATLDVNSSLQALGIAPYATLSGWVELQYRWPWAPLCAVIRNVDTTHSLIFTFGYEAPGPLSPQGPAAASRQVAEGLWWKHEANVTGFLSLSNTTSRPMQALVQISDSHATVLGKHTVNISAGGMKTLNLQELESAATKEGGIRVSYTGEPETLLINGGLEDPNVGYSANLRFAPPVRPVPPFAHATTQMGIAELGLMAGAADPMMRFPAGTTFTPYSVVRNVSNAAVNVKPTLWWMQSGGPASFQLPQITIGPYETRNLDLAASLVAAGLKNFNGNFNLVLDTQGNSGLLMAGGSVDQTNTYVFEVGARGIVKSAGKSLSYWSTGNGDDTMVMLWNPADEAQNFIFRIPFAGGHYDYPVQLAPKASRTFNVSEIVAGLGPDAEGNVIPSGIQEGSAKIIGDKADNQNILVVMDSGVYNVRKATCGGSCQNCDGASSSSVITDPFGVVVAMTNQENLTTTYCSGSQYTLTGNSSWSSSKTSVATVSGGLVRGVSPGSLVVSASDPTVPVCAPQCNPYGSCPAYQGTGGSSPGNVCPSSTTVSTLTPLGLTLLFPGIKTGIGAVASMQVSDSTGQNWNGTNVTESLIQRSNTCPSWGQNICSGSSTFPVGQGYQAAVSVNGVITPVGPVFPGTQNIFYDQHTETSNVSVLDASGINSCQAVCTQTYYCNGIPIGTHTITMQFIKALINGTHVTSTEVSKQ